MTAQAGGAAPSSNARSGDREQLRRAQRVRRGALSDSERTHHALRIALIAQRARMLRPGLHAAVYLAVGGEADLAPLIDVAWRLGCTLYLPVVADYRRSTMRFGRFGPGVRLRRNRFGIEEPVDGEFLQNVRRLDIVFAPLVAVDARGVRLGSGAGFYDRSLHHLRAGRVWRRPKMIGVAYEFQRVEHLEAAPWDVPLDALLTERRCYRFS